MDKIVLTREESMLVMRLLNLFLSTVRDVRALNNSDVAPAKALKQNIFNQYTKLDEKEAENDTK